MQALENTSFVFSVWRHLRAVRLRTLSTLPAGTMVDLCLREGMKGLRQAVRLTLADQAEIGLYETE
jgi:hypothetical protein